MPTATYQAFQPEARKIEAQLRELLRTQPQRFDAMGQWIPRSAANNNLTTGGQFVAASRGDFIYPDVGNQPKPGPMPQQANDDDDLRQYCWDYCMDLFLNSPDSLPGFGGNHQPRLKRCMNECMGLDAYGM